MSKSQTNNTGFVLAHHNKEFQLSLKTEFVVFYIDFDPFVLCSYKQNTRCLTQTLAGTHVHA